MIHFLHLHFPTLFIKQRFICKITFEINYSNECYSCTLFLMMKQKLLLVIDPNMHYLACEALCLFCVNVFVCVVYVCVCLCMFVFLCVRLCLCVCVRKECVVCVLEYVSACVCVCMARVRVLCASVHAFVCGGACM